MSVRKVTAAQADEIRTRADNGESKKSIAASYGISWGYAHYLSRRLTEAKLTQLMKETGDTELAVLRRHVGLDCKGTR